MQNLIDDLPATDGRTTIQLGQQKIFDYILQVRRTKGAGYFVLIDPDKWHLTELAAAAKTAGESGADAILIGGSLLLTANFDEIVQAIQASAGIPCILFPGSALQISRHADAMLFLSLVSGRNANFLIGEHVKAAPLIKDVGLETIATGYVLVESGSVTSAEFMSDTRPIPRDKHDIAKATALAAQYLGMQLIYLEAGSGAVNGVSPEMIRAVSGYVDIPIVVGGGIRTPEQAAACVKAGAAFVVTGNVLETKGGSRLIRKFAAAIHAAHHR